MRGPRWQFSAAQLWRVHLLALLTPVHSLNLLCTLLSEQRAWRSFARLRHRHEVPDVRILNAFRARVGVLGLRQINEVLLQPLIPIAALWENATALIDAANIQQAIAASKKEKRHRHLHRGARGPGWAHPQDGTEPLVRRLQEAQLPLLWWRPHQHAVLLVPLVSWVAPANVSEGGLLVPSLHYCDQRWAWWPRQIVADMGYLAVRKQTPVPGAMARRGGHASAFGHEVGRTVPE